QRVRPNAARYGAAAKAVPGQRAREPRMGARLAVAEVGSERLQRGRGGAMTYVVVASAALGGVLLFLLAGASGNTSLFAPHYPLLLILNAVIAAALVGLVGYQLLSLRRALRGRVFGSRLTLRLLVLFAIMAVVPGALVYTVSVQFLTKSIESWFDVCVGTPPASGPPPRRRAPRPMLHGLARQARLIGR